MQQGSMRTCRESPGARSHHAKVGATGNSAELEWRWTEGGHAASSAKMRGGAERVRLAGGCAGQAVQEEVYRVHSHFNRPPAKGQSRVGGARNQ